jgi:polar amino acid transport system substrate-binding protein
MPQTGSNSAAIVRRGALRLALFPSFFWRSEAGRPRGVGVSIAHALADRIGVPLVCTIHASPPAVVALLGIDPARAAEVDFSPPLLAADFTYLAPEGSTVHALADADRPGTRVALVRHHAMDTALRLSLAERVYAETPDAAFDFIRAGGADVLAGIRPGLLSYARRWPGARVLDERYGRNIIALAVRKSKPDWLADVAEFVGHARADGTVPRAIAEAGLAGVDAA